MQAVASYGCSKQSFSKWRKAENEIRANLRTASIREESQKHSHLPAIQNQKGEGDVAVGEEPQENEVMKTFQHYTDVSKAFPSAASIKNLGLAT